MTLLSNDVDTATGDALRPPQPFTGPSYSHEPASQARHKVRARPGSGTARLSSESGLDKRFIWLQRSYYSLLLWVPPLILLSGFQSHRRLPWLAFACAMALAGVIVTLNFYLYHSHRANSRLRSRLDSEVTSLHQSGSAENPLPQRPVDRRIP